MAKEKEWAFGELLMVDVTNLTGSVNLLSTNPYKPFLELNIKSKMFTGDIVVPIEEVWAPGSHHRYIKVMTARGVGYVSDWVLKNNVKPFVPEPLPVSKTA